MGHFWIGARGSRGSTAEVALPSSGSRVLAKVGGSGLGVGGIPSFGPRVVLLSKGDLYRQDQKT